MYAVVLAISSTDLELGGGKRTFYYVRIKYKVFYMR
jgi:hypothetical protein